MMVQEMRCSVAITAASKSQDLAKIFIMNVIGALRESRKNEL